MELEKAALWPEKYGGVSLQDFKVPHALEKLARRTLRAGCSGSDGFESAASDTVGGVAAWAVAAGFEVASELCCSESKTVAMTDTDPSKSRCF